VLFAFHLCPLTLPVRLPRLLNLSSLPNEIVIALISSGLNVYPACPMESFYPIPSG
jgi:hypothetical protein